MFKVLNIEDLKQEYESPDIYYEKRYLMANDSATTGVTRVALFHSDNSFIIYPFVVRGIELMSQKTDYFDCITPYEYGGPVVIGHLSINEIKRFFGYLSDYFKEEKIISEFVRFNPVLRNHLALEEYYDISFSRENIFIDLTKDKEVIFSEYHKNNRRDIRVALRNDVIVQKLEKNLENITMFRNLYYKVMDEKSAGREYYFSEDYFIELMKLDDRLLSLFVAKSQEGTPVSTSLFLHGNKFTHYHLSATMRSATKICPNNLLLHSAILDSKENAKTVFHLGGAASSQQGLYRFKSKFSKSRGAYYVGKKIHDRELYSELTNEVGRIKKEKNEQFNHDFFPGYRQ